MIEVSGIVLKDRIFANVSRNIVQYRLVMHYKTIQLREIGNGERGRGRVFQLNDQNDTEEIDREDRLDS